MLELMLCSMVTILPDYLLRRHVQGKRWGREITLFTVWYELRWGISACVILTISLITIIFYYHPSTSNVTSAFRTVTVLPELPGRVAEVMAQNNARVEAGQVLFRLDDSAQRAAAETARKRLAEIDAESKVARAERAAAIGAVEQAEGAYGQALDELETKRELRARNPDVVRPREIEQLERLVEGRQGALDAAIANREAVETRISDLLPAQRESAQAALEQAQVLLEKTVVRAGVAGRLEQFALKPGDVVNPLLRPAGLLVPTAGAGSGRDILHAGFGQISAQVLKPGMIAEASCAARPFDVIPMVVTEVQDVIAAGQLRPTDQLIDTQDLVRPGTITVFMEPLYAGQTHGVPPGSACIANAYTSNHERLAEPGIGLGERAFLHVVDAVGLIHAIILRIQTLFMPVKLLVFSGGH